MQSPCGLIHSIVLEWAGKTARLCGPALCANQIQIQTDNKKSANAGFWSSKVFGYDSSLLKAKPNVVFQLNFIRWSACYVTLEYIRFSASNVNHSAYIISYE